MGERTPERDTLEILLDLPELNEGRQEAPERDLKAVIDRHLPGRKSRLLSGRHAKGRPWLRLVVELGEER